MTDNKYIRATEICIAVAKRGQQISPQQLATATGIDLSVAIALIMELEYMWGLKGQILKKKVRNAE